ncbi:MAG: GNAT family N-acetyltransferase [Geminicoccaceae bacterium]
MAPAPPGLIVRAACADDVRALCEMANEPGYRHGTLRPPFQTLEATRQWFDALGGNDVMLVAEIDSQVVGSAGLHRQTGRRSHAGLIGMGVRDSWQRRGVGTTLLGALVDSADNWLDIRRLELTVYADNIPAIALYERFGFELEGRMRAHSFRAGSYVDTLLMARLRQLP